MFDVPHMLRRESMTPFREVKTRILVASLPTTNGSLLHEPSVLHVSNDNPLHY